ncbi:FecR family protein [Spiribacter halobius]|uniref:Iron dicitrate transport regulator FecR n=1 Tax=Sediminicurvatus halobius TaxID=2182432 RepID=A0A2U2N1P3_9GAMM|nr:FecR domain-containing protein [Spiribacter halobius]PWG63131.1 hypothetical protein DEM34_09790 [Spiribacter halobius]UEX77581.1 FecR domain-containing protein [Spiribacter halobius]
MSEPARDRPQNDPAWEAALDWLLALQAGGLDDTQQAALQRWLEADPRHHAAFAEAQRVWGVTGHVTPAHAAWPRPQRQRPRRRWLPLAAAAVLVAGITAILATGALDRWRHDLVAGVAELRTEALADGSRVTLAPGSAADVSMDASSRHLTLRRGAIYLDVARDAERPFVVTAGETRVAVIGTRFTVRRSDVRVRVAVAEGRVRVERGRAGVDLAAGQAVAAGGGAMQPQRVPRQQVGSWREGRLRLRDATIAEGVAALRPWHRGIILDPPQALAQRRISGIYDLQRPQAALAAMLAPHDGTVAAFTPWLLRIESPDS